MVAIFLILPPLLCAGLYLFGLVTAVSQSSLFYWLLAVTVLAAILAAAWRRKRNIVLMSAWLFLFCGMLLFSLSEIVEFYLGEGQLWIAELFEAASFFPLVIFIAYAASPLRLIILPGRRRAVYLALGAVVLLAIGVLVLLPWLALPQPAKPGFSPRHAMRLLKPLLDAVLLEPLGLIVLVLGVSQGRDPLLLIGLGLMLGLPADILDSYHLLSRQAAQEQLAHLFSIGSQLYILAGALLCAISPAPQDRSETPPVG